MNQGAFLWNQTDHGAAHKDTLGKDSLVPHSSRSTIHAVQIILKKGTVILIFNQPLGSSLPPQLNLICVSEYPQFLLREQIDALLTHFPEHGCRAGV